MDKTKASAIIDHGLKLGADFVEVFDEQSHYESAQVLSDKVNDVNIHEDAGVGIRLIYGSEVFYTYSNSQDLDVLRGLVSKVTDKDPASNSKNNQGIQKNQFTDLHPVIHPIGSEQISIKDKTDFLLSLNQQTKVLKKSLSQIDVSYMQKQQNIQVFNSDGLFAADSRNYFRLHHGAYLNAEGKQVSSSVNEGFLAGWESIDQINIDEFLRESIRQAEVLAIAKPSPAGTMPVIIGNAFGGVIFHEACGHSLETTSVAPGVSVFSDKKGKQIANSVVTAIDDGTIVNAWGSLNVDDEGRETEKTVLIENGILKNFLCDKVGHLKTGHRMTGSSRRQSYHYAPTSRMRNTYIDNGDSNLDEMIASIDHGLYCKSMGGGSVSPSTGEFNFAVREGYVVKNGKVEHAVTGATLIGSGQDILHQISMVGNDLELAAGVCGSISGAVNTTVGQPSLKVDSIVVGGSKT